MPGSSDLGKDFTKNWFDTKDFKTILDVGPGWGTYSKLLRKDNTIWDCVEIHEAYVNRFNLNSLYNNIFIYSISDFKYKHFYDVVIFGDVLEHMSKELVHKSLDRAKQNSKYMIISIPLDEESHAEKGTGAFDWDNIYEEHVSMWTFDSFSDFLKELNIEIESFERHSNIAIFICKGNL